MAEEHKELLEQFEHDWQADRHNREDGLEDLEFAAGNQWLDSVRQAREAAGRPVITINKTGQFIRQVSGELRQSEPSIEFVPVDGQTDPHIAEIYQGIMRQIEYRSAASAAYAWGAEQAITCGIGHWRICTEYANDDTFDQDIKIKRIMDPFSVVWDAGATEIDRRDASHCFVTEWLTKDQYKKEYKTKTEPDDFPSGMTNSQNFLYWNTEDRIRVASRWYKVPMKRKLGLLDTGETVDLTQLGAVAKFLNVVRTRDVQGFKVMHQKLSGDAILSEEEWAGAHIPIIPIIGNEVCIDGRMIRFGVVRWMKDPARLYNYFRSASAELTALQPKAPYLVPFESIEGLENWWSKANTENLPYLPYKLSKDAPNARPTREPPPQASAAMYQESSIADADMNATTGIYPASLGQRSNETSGKAILARQREGDTGTFVYFDNFNHAIRWTGEQCADLIAKIYDGERQVRILGADETEQMAVINKSVQTPFGPAIINDISQAKFDVRVKTGPSFASAREQGKQALSELMQAQPQLMPIMGDLYFEVQDFPGAKKIAERFKKTMQPGLISEQEGGAPQPQPDPMLEMAQRVALLEKQATIENKQASTGKVKAETAKIMSETHGKAIDNEARLHSHAREQFTFENPEPPEAQDQFAYTQ
jgi:Phage P22-like portal protein